GTSAREMDWMMSEYKTLHYGEPYLGSFTGKSVLNGGSLGRQEATGKGVYFTLRYLLYDYLGSHREQLEQSACPYAVSAVTYWNRSITVAVQGFGNVGSVLATEAYHCPYLRNRVVAVSDRNVTLYHEDGLDIPRLSAYAKQNAGELPSSADQLQVAGVQADLLDREAILYLDVDVLALAALEDQIRADNVSRVKAGLLVEGANAPISG